MAGRLSGNLDGVFGEHVLGWAWDEMEPGRVVSVDIVVDGRHVVSVPAGKFRADLRRAGLGTGEHAFDVALPPEFLDGRPHTVEVVHADGGPPLPGSPCALAAGATGIPDLKIDPGNQSTLEPGGHIRVGLLLVELNDTCNAECIYCPNPRSRARLDLVRLEALLARVDAVETVQFGCGQEPTADPRLLDAFAVLARSGVVARQQVRLITNGVLLHRHDARLLRERGLTTLAVSLDAADEATNDRLRPGAPLRKVLANVRAFRQQCPDVALELSITVTRLNVEGMDAVVRLGTELGASRYVLREVSNTCPPHQTRQADFQDVYASLALAPGEFQRMQAALVRDHGLRDLVFQPREQLEAWVDSAYGGEARATAGPVMP